MGYGVLPELWGEAHGVVLPAASDGGDGSDFPDDLELMLLMLAA